MFSNLIRHSTHNTNIAARRRGILQRCLPALGATLLGVASAMSASASTDTISAPGASTWTVPANVSSVQIVAIGGGGAGSMQGPSSGGNGGKVTANVAVSAGQVLSLFVGGGGSLGNFGVNPKDGGGGGGSTTINAGTAGQIIAGGGGGGGYLGATGGDGNGSAGATLGTGNGGGGGSNGTGGAGGAGPGGYPGGDGGSGNGGAGGSGSNAPGGTGAGSGSGGNNNSSYGGGGGGGYGGGGAGGDNSAQGGGGGGGGSVGPAGAVIAVGGNAGLNGATGGNGSITITYSAVVGTTESQPIPNLGSLPGIPNVGSQLTVLDMSGGSGPSMTTCLLNALKQMFGAEATYLGQSVNGVVRISQAGQVISFYPLAASTSTAQGIGIVFKADGSLSVGTSCGSFSVVPAVANVPELGSALTAMGLNVQIGAQGVITTTVNGTLYAVRPDYFVTQAAATGKATIAFGSDGVLRFTDSAGNVQILRAAFLDPSGLQSFMGAALGGTLTIQADASGVFTLINGQQLLLAPEMQLSPAGLNAANWVNDKANHYLYRIGASYQGLSAVSR